MRRAALLLSLALLLAAPAHAAGAQRTGRLLVTLERDARASSAQARSATARAVAAAAGAAPSGPAIPQIRLVTVRPRPGQSLRSLARRLRADPRVADVSPEHRGDLRFQPNDPALALPETAPATAPGTTVEWWAPRSGFLQAWDISRGAGATVAVIDTGAEVAHPELAGRVAGLRTFDTARTPAGVDTIGHGTHVASLACAAGNNGVGLAGAGLGCRLLIAKSDFTDASVAASIVWAVDNGADAINMSFGTPPGAQASLPVINALDYAIARRVVLVAAAADDPIEDQGYPASALQPTGTGPDITQGRGLSVTAADFFDRRAQFAGRGTQISLAAYGAYQGATDDGPPGIFGAFTSALNALDTGAVGDRRPCRCRVTFAADPRYAYLQGTSMAAPMVAAAAALIRQLNPDMGSRGIARLIKQTARRPPGTGWNPELGWGILDAGTALATARTLDRRPPTSKIRAVPRRTRRTVLALRWRGRDVPRRGVALSGLARYELWRSVDGNRPRRLLTTRGTARRVRVRRGSRYRFFTVAVDKAGNRERAPRLGDVRVTVRRR
ncbi:MAG TPA: S8 family serine peptidase [Solirubrobacteraceae bacterium]|nr:S8 family serine peptidase [Solirubrobacteraceae bacterium]